MIGEENKEIFQVGNHTVIDIATSPQALLAFALISFSFLLVGAALRLTRISNVTTEGTYDSSTQSNIRELQNQFSFKSLFTIRAIFGNWKSFWGILPRRFWNFYVDAFIIASYRKEWGKYQAWSHRSTERRPQIPIVKAELHRKRMDELEQAKLGPNPTPHDHSGCSRITCNVAGMRYETQLRTLQRFPETLLGNNVKLAQFYDPMTQEYYFDRNRHAFEAILYYYQSGGRFRRPDNVPAEVLLNDAIFFQLSHTVIDQYRFEEGLTQSTDIGNEVVPLDLLRRKVWLLFEFPESSIQAQIVAVLSMMALFLSIASFCLETLEPLDLRPVYFVNSSGHILVERVNWTDIHDPFFFVETICVSWFILEFLTRLICCPILSRFLKSPLNLIDGIALCPYFFTLFTSADLTQDNTAASAAESLYFLRIIRIVRVFRIFKLSKHSKGLKILGQTLRASMNELLLLCFFMALGVIFFSSMIYFAELEGSNTKYSSVIDGFWWALITLTTVGYGDIVPTSDWGKTVGTLCAIAGVLAIALPVPVIVSNFNYFYQQAMDQHDFSWKNINHVACCPYRPQGFRPLHHFYLPSQVHHHKHPNLFLETSETDLTNLSKNNVTGSQQQLNDSIRSYVRAHKNHPKNQYNSSEEEFGVLMQGKRSGR